MENFYLLTYIDKDIEFDLVKQQNLDKIQVMAVDLDFVENIGNNIITHNMTVISVEPYSVLKFKVKILEDFIKNS